MIPRITTGGASFRGAFLYYLHDKDASTRNRVAWTHTENVLTRDPAKAWKVMAYTAKEQARLKEASGQKSTGRKLEKAVFAYSLSWHPEQNPGREHMLNTARRSIAVLGMTEHEAIIVAHRDEPQRHVHIVLNRVHPVTGLAARLSKSKLLLSGFAHAYETEHGKIYCQQRAENQQQREKGRNAMYLDPVIRDAWTNSENGAGFIAALAKKGYQLAKGRSRLVVVDPHGKSINPVRHLEDVRTKEFNARLRDLDPSLLPEADTLSKAVSEANRRSYELSQRYDREFAEKRERIVERQREERIDAERRLSERLTREKQRLEEQHRLQETAIRITRLRGKVEHPKWWQRLFGITRTARLELQRLEFNERNTRIRIEERIKQIADEDQKLLSQLSSRHADDLRLAEADHAARRPKSYCNESERAKLRDVFDERNPRHSGQRAEYER